MLEKAEREVIRLERATALILVVPWPRLPRLWAHIMLESIEFGDGKPESSHLGG